MPVPYFYLLESENEQVVTVVRVDSRLGRIRWVSKNENRLMDLKELDPPGSSNIFHRHTARLVFQARYAQLFWMSDNPRGRDNGEAEGYNMKIGFMTFQGPPWGTSGRKSYVSTTRSLHVVYV